MRFSYIKFGLLFLSLAFAAPSTHAQLADNFYNLTSVETKTFPNALQITIRADGVLSFGADFSEFVDIGPDRFNPRAVSSFRLRFLNARSKLPTIVPIGKYPLDSILVTPGRDSFEYPVFGYVSSSELQTDLTFQFFTPVTLRDLEVETWDSLPFGSYLNPLDVRVEKGDDSSSVIITIVPDRVDARRSTPALSEAPAKIVVAPNGDGTFRVETVRAPITDLLTLASRVTSTSLLLEGDAANARISLFLPRATVDSFLRVLETAHDFRTTRGANQIRIARGDAITPDTSFQAERIPLQNLEAEQARSLLPDFLLPLVRADRENNALLVYASPRVAAHVRKGLSTLDTPRALVKIEATAWEILESRENESAIQFQGAGGNTSFSLNTASGQFSFQVDAQNARRIDTTLKALSQQGRAKLIVEPTLVVASGARGTLFLGQNRFVPVLQNTSFGQTLEIIELGIGYELNVRPLVGAGDEISIEINPRFSTLESTESGTGLPTLGLREIGSNLRVREGEMIVIGGLDSDLKYDARRRTFVRTSRDDRSRTNLLVLLRVRKL